MTKKIIAILLVAAMVFTLAACGEEPDQVYKVNGSTLIQGFGTTLSNSGALSKKSGYSFQLSISGVNNYSRDFDDDALAQVYLVTGTQTSNVNTYTPNVLTLTGSTYSVDKTVTYTKVLDAQQLLTIIAGVEGIAEKLASLGIKSNIINNILEKLQDFSSTLKGIDFVLYADKVSNNVAQEGANFILVAGLPLGSLGECVFVVPDVEAAAGSFEGILDYIKGGNWFNK